MATGAQAGKPVLGTVIESDHLYPWESQRVNASEWTEGGYATEAFNFLQDKPLSFKKIGVRMM